MIKPFMFILSCFLPSISIQAHEIVEAFEAATITLEFTSGSTKDKILHIVEDDTIHVLVPHHAQNIYDPDDDRKYGYTVTHELADGWELVDETIKGDAYEVKKRPSADEIAPATKEEIYILKLKREEEGGGYDEDGGDDSGDGDGDGEDEGSDNAPEAEEDKAEYKIIIYTPTINLTLHSPGKHGSMGEKMKRPETEEADTVEGFDTGYVGVMQRNEDNDDGDEIPEPPADRPRDNDDETPSSDDDDLVALLMELEQPGDMPDDLKALVSVNLEFQESSDSQVQVFDEDESKVSLDDLSSAKNLTEAGEDKHLSKLIEEGEATIYLEGLGSSEDSPDNRWGDKVDQVTLVLTPGGEYKEAKSHGLLTSIEVVELSPKLKDVSGKEIVGSEIPVFLPKRNAMVEIDPFDNRIAHREMKVKVGKELKGKKITWSMQAFGVKNEDKIRGNWDKSKNHKNRFETSPDFATKGFKDINQESAQTIVDDEGFTSIRANLPPIGWNQAKIKIKIENIDKEFELISFEVPAIIVIDPGHGNKKVGSSKIGGKGGFTKVQEYETALDIALRIEKLDLNKYAPNRLVKLFLTKKTNKNISFPERTKIALDNGGDTYISIHFDASTNNFMRSPFYILDYTGNHNLEKDRQLALDVRQKIQQAINNTETQSGKQMKWNSQYPSSHWEKHWENQVRGLDTLSDYVKNTIKGNGNVKGYAPCRAALLEVEWTTHEAADHLFNSNKKNNKLGRLEASRSAVAISILEGCLKNIKEYK